jgi:hypothetical protein
MHDGYSRRHDWLRAMVRWRGKALRAMRAAAHVIAGSLALAKKAREYNARLTVVPSVVEARTWTPVNGRVPGALLSPDLPVVGWVGVSVRHRIP